MTNETNKTVNEALVETNTGFYWDHKERLLCELDGGGHVVIRGDGDGLTMIVPIENGFGHVHLGKAMCEVIAQWFLHTQGLYHTATIKGDADAGTSPLGEP